MATVIKKNYGRNLNPKWTKPIGRIGYTIKKINLVQGTWGIGWAIRFVKRTTIIPATNHRLFMKFSTFRTLRNFWRRVDFGEMNSLRFEVRGLRFRVPGSGVSSLQISNFKFRVSSSRFQVQGSRFSLL